MAHLRVPEKERDYEYENPQLYVTPQEQPKPTTVRAQIFSQNNQENGKNLFDDLSLAETLLIIVCGICFLVLALSIAYFYLARRLGRFSDNPWYKRRMYYAMSSSTTTQNPARCFNVYKRERPNTLSLSGAIATPPTIVVPVPMMDVGVGDDRIYDKKSKNKSGKTSKLNISSSESKHRLSALSANAVAPLRKSSSKKQQQPPPQKEKNAKQGLINLATANDDGNSSDEYITPPQDLAPFRSSAHKEKISTAGRSHKK